jgi:hypothetical protein
MTIIKLGITLFLLFFAMCSFAQDIVKVIFTSQLADEPPTKQGQSVFRIKYQKDPNGDLLSTEFFENIRSNKLDSRIVIDKETIKRVSNWHSDGKRIFTSLDLNF